MTTLLCMVGVIGFLLLLAAAGMYSLEQTVKAARQGMSAPLPCAGCVECEPEDDETSAALAAWTSSTTRSRTSATTSTTDRFFDATPMTAAVLAATSTGSASIDGGSAGC